MAELIADPFRAARLILSLRKAGVRDNGVLRAMETIDRGVFADPRHGELAFEDCMLPIPCGQTMLRPSTIGRLLQTLELSGQDTTRALLIGGGSGYLACLMAQMAEHVFVVERYAALASSLTERFESLGVSNITVRHGDGLRGWPERSPFDRIALSGAVETIPPVLVTQLSPGGIAVAPIQTTDGTVLQRLEKGGLSTEAALPITVPPLVEGVAAAL